MIKTFFGFKTYPFSKEISSKDIFMSECFKELFSRLEYIRKNRGLMQVTGEPGTGKTLAMRAFIESLNPNLYFPIYTPLTTISQIELYRQLNFRLTGETLHRKVDLFHSIQKAVKDLVTNKKRVPVIVIDEAHLLKPENLYEIQIILNFDIDSTDPLIFIMVGQSHLRDKLQRPVHDSLNQRFSLRYHLMPLNREETESYLLHHLTASGCKENIFSPQAIEAIFQSSGGVPRNIGNLAFKSLTLGASKRKQIITEEEVFVAAKEL